VRNFSFGADMDLDPGVLQGLRGTADVMSATDLIIPVNHLIILDYLGNLRSIRT
jgi:hypothetical protein